MKCVLIFIVILLGFTNAKARVGMGEIQFQTPGGHIICDCDPYAETPVLIGFESSIKNLQKWYFYREYIIGYGKNYYFIFNEATSKLLIFKEKETWQQAISRQNLKPFFTRWLDISDSIETLYTVIVLGMFIWVPLLLVLCIGGFIFFYATEFNKRKSIIGVLLLFAITITLLYRINIHSF